MGGRELLESGEFARYRSIPGFVERTRVQHIRSRLTFAEVVVVGCGEWESARARWRGKGGVAGKSLDPFLVHPKKKRAGRQECTFRIWDILTVGEEFMMIV